VYTAFVGLSNRCAAWIRNERCTDGSATSTPTIPYSPTSCRINLCLAGNFIYPVVEARGVLACCLARIARLMTKERSILIQTSPRDTFITILISTINHGPAANGNNPIAVDAPNTWPASVTDINI
jgi:hypothetical protein